MNHPSWGFDCEGSIAGIRAPILDAGLGFHGGYYGGHASKDLTADDLLWKDQNGIGTLAYYEAGGDSISGFSAEQGTIDAQQAFEQAARLGQPAGTPVFFAVDLDAMPGQEAQNIEPYFESVSKVAINTSYKVGVYGSGLSCQTIIGQGLASSSVLGAIGWQLGHQWLPHADFVQKPPSDPYGFGIEIDPLFAQTPSGGLWTVSGALTLPAASLTPAAPATTAAVHARLLRFGDTGDDVRVLQGRLGLPVDGIFGPVTELAVKTFEARCGLTTDGVVGPDVRAALAQSPVS